MQGGPPRKGIRVELRLLAEIEHRAESAEGKSRHPSFRRTARGRGRLIRIVAAVAKMGVSRGAAPRSLIDQGLLAYLDSRKERALFYDPVRSRGGKDARRLFRKTGVRLAE